MLTVELPVLVSFFRISPQVGLALLVAVIAEAVPDADAAAEATPDAEADAQQYAMKLPAGRPPYNPGCGLMDTCCGMSNEGCCMGGQQCYTYYENVCENVNEPQCNMKGREFCEPVTLPDCRVTKERGKLVSDDHQGCVYSSSLVAHLAAVAASRVHIPRHSNQMLYIK